jgi:hypothetical protein
MYEKMNYILDDYLSHDSNDYSLLISGKWGCGKTYYINYGIDELLDDHSLNKLYISLNGLSSVSDVKKKIFLSKLKEKHGGIINIDFLEQINDIGKMIPKVGEIFNFTEKLAEKSLDNIDLDLENDIIIFDDLERISSKIEIDEVFGFIYDNFIYKDVRTLFVGNDSELSAVDGYDRIKEKIFRRIIDFHPEIELLCQNFIDARYKKKQTYEYICSKIELISWFIEELEERNLRTLEFALDTFNKVYDSLDLEDSIESSIETIFVNIIILSIEFKNGKIGINNLKDKNGLDKAKEEYFSKELTKYMNLRSGKEDKSTEEKKYSEIFHELYVERFGLNFVFIDSIFNFIITGYLNEVELNNEIQSIFNKSKSEWENALDHIVDNKNSEEGELLDNIEKVIKFLYEGKYNISRFPYIYSVLNYIKLRIYDESWKFDDLEMIMRKAIELSSKNECNIPTIRQIENIDHLYYDDSKNTPFYSKLISDIKKLASTKDNKTIKDQLEKLLDYSTQDNNSFIDLYNEIDKNTFFEDLFSTGNYTKVLSLNNRGIRRIKTIAHENILRISNAGEFHYIEKTYIDKIVKYISDNLDTERNDKLRKIRIQELLETLKSASEHLEKTKKNL